jgi:hypothetical protein
MDALGRIARRFALERILAGEATTPVGLVDGWFMIPG